MIIPLFLDPRIINIIASPFFESPPQKKTSRYFQWKVSPALHRLFFGGRDAVFRWVSHLAGMELGHFNLYYPFSIHFAGRLVGLDGLDGLVGWLVERVSYIIRLLSLGWDEDTCG